jgi:type I restriction enzyme M protein
MAKPTAEPSKEEPIEKQLWKAADKLRKNIDAAEYKHIVLGHVFEYFLGEFALAEGKQGGQFYTPRSIVELLVKMLEPCKGRVFDPCCGSGGMFVQSEKLVAEHQGKVNDISIYGQESNQTTWRLAKMNLAIRSIDSSQVKWNNEGSFLNDSHKDLKASAILRKSIG